MCLYNKLIKNRKYTENKNNGGLVPAVTDPRTLYVPIGCGKCIECMKKRSREWQIRLTEDIKHNKNGKFITLTFSNESIQELCKHEKAKNLKGYELDNQIATISVHYFRERWRKHFKKSIRHWLITELGHNGTENIHLHGILWTNENYQTISNHWQYGFIWPRPEYKIDTYVNEQTIGYMVKYVSKIDKDHELYIPITLTSPGIGKDYINSKSASLNKFNKTNTKETYTLPNGYEMSLPIYFRNNIYTPEEREKLWLQQLDKNERWICGEKIKADDTKNYYKLLEWYRQKNAILGYGSDKKNWEREEYEIKRRELLQLQRMLNEHGYPASWDE